MTCQDTAGHFFYDCFLGLHFNLTSFFLVILKQEIMYYTDGDDLTWRNVKLILGSTSRAVLGT